MSVFPLLVSSQYCGRHRKAGVGTKTDSLGPLGSLESDPAVRETPRQSHALSLQRGDVRELPRAAGGRNGCFGSCSR